MNEHRVTNETAVVKRRTKARISKVIVALSIMLGSVFALAAPASAGWNDWSDVGSERTRCTTISWYTTCRTTQLQLRQIPECTDQTVWSHSGGPSYAMCYRTILVS